ncbi:hypothetical protein LINPERHAP2_LOCUS36336 [Linum perenne]
MAPTPTNAIIDIEDDLDDPSNLDFQISRHQFVMQFPRPEYMNLNDDQIDVAYYIFSRGLQTDEVLVKNNYYFCDRGSLWTLLPGKWVDSFKLVLEHEWIPDKVDEYQNSFLRSAINCRKVNFMGDVFKVLYLKRGIDKPVPDVAKFKIIIPPSVPRQDNTYDCGIWVTKWMEYHESLFDDYIHVVRNNLDRMHLAIKLVMGPHNQILEHILGQVEQHAIIRKRAINWYLDGKDTAEDGMRYSDNWRARRFLEFGI